MVSLLAEAALKGISTEGADVGALGKAKGFAQDNQAVIQAGIKNIGEAIALASSIYKLVLSFKAGDQLTKDLKKDRYKVGLLFPGEDRDALVRSGEVNGYYSTDNIRSLIKLNKTPATWSVQQTTLQGFADEIRDQRLLNSRQRHFNILSNSIRSDIIESGLKEESKQSKLLKEQAEEDRRVKRFLNNLFI